MLKSPCRPTSKSPATQTNDCDPQLRLTQFSLQVLRLLSRFLHTKKRWAHSNHGKCLCFPQISLLLIIGLATIIVSLRLFYLRFTHTLPTFRGKVEFVSRRMHGALRKHLTQNVHTHHILVQIMVVIFTLSRSSGRFQVCDVWGELRKEEQQW